MTEPRLGQAFAYANPVVRGNAPDPSVIRVGTDYFLATSSFEYLPGIVIRRSTDLVSWRIVGAAVTRPAQYRRDGRPGTVMLFAPTLRHHDGTFYVACTNMADGQGNFVVRARDPAGEWSDAVWLDREAFDPSLFFDEDGTCYYTRRTLDLSAPGGDLGPVVQAVLDPRTGEMGPLRPITPGPWGFESNDIEGPHLYRIGGWYYLFAAEGGTWIGHMQTVARSRSPWGPFEPAPHNPIITHRHRVLHPIQSLGHADLVEDPRGRWWALALGTRHRREHHNLGRETFLLPVEWRDGWPHVGADGGTELEVALPHSGPETGGVRAGPERSLLTEGWHTLSQPPPGLALDGTGLHVPFGAELADGSALDPPGAVLRFQTEEAQVLAAIAPSPVGGQEVGVGAYSDGRHHYLMLLRIGAGGREVVLRRVVDDLETEAVRPWPGEGPVRMEVRAAPDGYRFAVADGEAREDGARDDGAWVEIGGGSARLLSAQACEWFVGVNFALCAFGGGGGVAAFAEVGVT
jgi:alpha-N-arabinofuranosidase